VLEQQGVEVPRWSCQCPSTSRDGKPMAILGITAGQHKGHADVVDVTSCPQANSILHPTLLDETELAVQVDGSSVLRPDEKLDLPRGRLVERPVEQGPQEHFAVAASPVSKVDAHVQAKDVRHLLQAHRPQRRVANGLAVELGDQVLATAVRQSSDSVVEIRLDKFIRLRHKKTIVEIRDFTFSLAQHRCVLELSVAEQYHGASFCRQTFQVIRPRRKGESSWFAMMPQWPQTKLTPPAVGDRLEGGLRHRDTSMGTAIRLFMSIDQPLGPVLGWPPFVDGKRTPPVQMRLPHAHRCHQEKDHHCCPRSDEVSRDSTDQADDNAA